MVFYLKKCFSILLLGFSLTMFAEDKEATIWMIGDSITQTYAKRLAPLAGIGQALPKYCKSGIKVENRAVSGTSTKSFQDKGFWKPVLAGIKKDDYLLIKFGHNDQKKNKSVIYAEAQTTYSQNLVKFIKAARAKGAQPVLITPMCRRVFYTSGAQKGALRHSLGEYPKYCRLVAKEQNVPLIDLNSISFNKIGAMSHNESKKLYNHVPKGSKYPYWNKKSKNKKNGHVDNTHLNLNGAKIVDSWLVDDAKKQKLKLAKLFK
jgi:DNA sulfur modification protein DndE